LTRQRGFVESPGDVGPSSPTPGAPRRITFDRAAVVGTAVRAGLHDVVLRVQRASASALGELPRGLDIQLVAIEEPNSDGELAPSSSFSDGGDILAGPLAAWSVDELPGTVDTDDTGALITVLVSSDRSLDRQAVHTVRLGGIQYRADGHAYSFATNRTLGVVARVQFEIPDAVECIPGG